MKSLFLLLLIFSTSATAAGSNLYIEQIGDNNNITVNQKDASNNSVNIDLGKISNVDYTTLNILQQGTGNKTASVEVKSGINNGINLTQDGAGAHSATIQNLQGSANNISITQSGSGKHEFNLINNSGKTNNNNTVNVNQSGGVGQEKWFNIWLNGASGAVVNVNQSGAANQASMQIQCSVGTCGTYNFSQ